MRARKLVSVVLLVLFQASVAVGSGLEVELATSHPAIFKGQSINATIRILNNSTSDIEIPRPQRSSFTKCIEIDNPKLRFASGTSIVSVGGEKSTIILKPGQSATHQIWLYVMSESSTSTITFRAGIKFPPAKTATWSNPITVNLKPVEEMLQGEPLAYDELRLDPYCFALSFAFLTSQKPVIERQLIINSNQEYQRLLVIRRGRQGKICPESNGFYDKVCQSEQKCLTMSLPVIDFNKKTVLAQYTSGSCATTGFNRKVLKDEHKHVINYVVEPIKSIFACSGPPGQSLNLIAISKIPADYKVNFLYKNF